MKNDELRTLELKFVENYEPSKTVEKNARFVVEATPPGNTFRAYASEKSKEKHFLEKTIEHLKDEASVNAEYYARASELGVARLEKGDKKHLINAILDDLKDDKTYEASVEEGNVGVLMFHGNIMQTPDGEYWVDPIDTDEQETIVPIERWSSFTDYYDLTGGTLRNHLPNLEHLEETKYGFTHYKKTTS